MKRNGEKKTNKQQSKEINKTSLYTYIEAQIFFKSKQFIQYRGKTEKNKIKYNK